MSASYARRLGSLWVTINHQHGINCNIKKCLDFPDSRWSTSLPFSHRCDLINLSRLGRLVMLTTYFHCFIMCLSCLWRRSTFVMIILLITCAYALSQHLSRWFMLCLQAQSRLFMKSLFGWPMTNLPPVIRRWIIWRWRTYENWDIWEALAPCNLAHSFVRETLLYSLLPSCLLNFRHTLACFLISIDYFFLHKQKLTYYLIYLD